MSTDLYGVRILEVDEAERRVRMRVFVVYYDTHHGYHQPIPDDRSFFVRVLCDKGALVDDIDQDARFDEAYVDRTAFRFVERFVKLEEKNHPLDSYEGYSDFYYERGGRWQDEDKLVQAVYDVYLTRPEYTRALAVGDSWGTTAYMTDADQLSLADYPHVPDFGDTHRHLIPFPDAEKEATVVDTLSFSADGTRLLATDNERGLRVFSLPGLACIAEQKGDDDFIHQPGWTHDGRVALWLGGQIQAIDLDTGAAEPFGPHGPQSSSDGTRFLNLHGEEGVQVRDQDGNALFSTVRAPDLMSWVTFDAAKALAVLHIEQAETLRIDMGTGETQPLSLGRVNGLALSPCGAYLLVSTYRMLKLVRMSDQAVIRHLPFRRRLLTAVAWSPTGELVAVSTCDQDGYRSEVTLHRIGRLIEAAERAPLALPPQREHDITDVVRLYLEQTRSFDHGWRSHLDDDRMDFHLALIRMGHDLDLVPAIDDALTQVATRAYEAVLWHQRGDTARAHAALSDAQARLRGNEPDRYGHTRVYAPLAAAQHVLGFPAVSEASWVLAQQRLDEEANRFQKRAILGRCLLLMDRAEEVEALIEPAASPHTFGHFHQRLLLELLHHGEWARFRQACDAWKLTEGWNDVSSVLRQRGLTGAEAPADFREWLAAAFDLSGEEDDRDAPLPTEPSPNKQVAWFAERGRWEDAYAVISTVKPAQRAGLCQVVARAALAQRALHILLDMLPRIPCGDMNAPGLRLLQASVRTLAGGAFRENHM